MKFRLSVVALLFFFTAGIWLMPGHAQKSGSVSTPGGSGKNGGGQSGGVASQGSKTGANALAPQFSRAANFARSVRVRDLPRVARQPSKKEFLTDVPDRNVNPQNSREIRTVAPNALRSPDAAITQTPVPNVIPGPTNDFDGQNNNDNLAAFGFRVSPPDTDGDVGPNHYVQQVNLLVEIFDKAGNSLQGPFKLSDLFAPLGGICATNDDGDPIVLYDPLADRWLLSQFAFTAINSPPYHMCIAISQTPDPTGAYFLYDFIVGGNNFPDYPKLGVWPDGYYMTTNQFFLGGAFNGAGAFSFEREKMIVGDPTASQIYFDLNITAFPEAIGGMLPSDLDGLLTPPPGAPNTFAYFTATEFGDPADGLRLFDFHSDFVTPANSTFTERAESSLAAPVPVAAFDPVSRVGRADVDQPAPGIAVDAISDRLMHRLQYRNMGGTEILTTTHTVDASGNTTAAVFRAGIRTYELSRTTGMVNPFAVIEQSTFSPDTDNRWMGSAAIDNQGNLAVGYSRSSTTTFPSVYWAGRLVGDPPNGLAQGEALVEAGTGVQTSAGSRWGDYSAMAVDPVDDCTFWYTQEYYTAAGQASSTVGWNTRIGNFSFPGCTPPAQGTLNGQITNCSTGAPIPGAIVTFTGGPSNGFSGTANGTGNYSRDISPGTYTVTATAPGFAPATQMGVVVSNGMTTTVNLCLVGQAELNAGNQTIVTEGCDPANGAIDPGETVTVSLCLTNIGGADTTNLVGTLQSTGGVTNPSGPQNYGVVMTGGPEVCRDFTFTASGTCGGMITATLDLQDGATNLGTVSFSFQLGVPGAFSYTGPAVPIPDNNPAGVDVQLLVSGAPTVINDVNFRIDGTGPGAAAGVDHTWVGDLAFTLTAPDGTTSATIIDRPGVPVSTFGCSLNDFFQTLLDDSAGSPIETQCSNGMSGTFTPNNPLSVFNGLDANGTWTLHVTDSGPGDTGNIQAFSLIFNNITFDCCIGEGDCIITCPDNIVVPNDTDQCGAVVNFPPPTPLGACGAITCDPPSGSFFPVGVTTVTCVAEGGGGGGGEVCQTFGFTGTVPIPDNTPAGADATLMVTHPGTSITDIDVMLDGTGADAAAGVDHSWVGDLIFTLESPSGTQVTIIDRPGVPVSALGCSLDDFFMTLLDDDGAFPPIETACSNGMSGSFSPNNPLSAFDGEDPNGTWTLNVADVQGGDTGNIRAFSLAICADGGAGIAPMRGGKGGGGIPIGVGKGGDPAPNGGGACPPTTITGALGSGSPDWPSVSGTQTGRLNRNGIASSCAAPKACLIFDSTPGRAFDAYTFTNNSGGTACVMVTLNVLEQTASNFQVNAYLGTYDPANICTNYLADPGLSSGIPPTPVSMSFNVPDGMDFVLAVHTTNPGEIGGAYELMLNPDAFCVAGPPPGGTNTCSFTVTVQDVQPPVITCPGNIITKTANPADACVPVNFNVTATDNCPGVTIQCVESNGGTVITSGFCFPATVTCTTVTCTATDASGNTAQCSFTVSVYDICMEDDGNPSTRELVWNSFTGDYIFCCDGTAYCGTAKVRRKGAIFTIEHFTFDRRLFGTVNTSQNRGTASLQFTSGADACTIEDRNIRNNFFDCAAFATCSCDNAPPPAIVPARKSKRDN